MFLWTCRTHFLQPSQKFFAQSPKILLSKCENERKVFFQNKCFSSTCFSEHVECSCDNTAKNFGQKSEIDLNNLYIFCKMKIFPQKVLLDKSVFFKKRFHAFKRHL